MSLAQFTQSLAIIRRAEHANRPEAVLRHLYFQGRKLLFPRPLTLRLSQSCITDDEPGGVISMVNMLGVYDYNNMNLVQAALRDGGMMIDVGANIGSYTLIASENATARVIALEPNPATNAKLQRNVQLNGRGNVEALQLAASAAPGQLRMTNLQKSALNHIVDDGSLDPNANTILVEVTTLDRLCAARHLWPRVMKLDVEGHEASVLAGAETCLRSVDVVLVENGHRPEIVARLNASGLRGPFYYNHATRCMRLHPQRLPEDSVFLGPGFRQLLPEVRLLPAGDEAAPRGPTVNADRTTRNDVRLTHAG